MTKKNNEVEVVETVTKDVETMPINSNDVELPKRKGFFSKRDKSAKKGIHKNELTDGAKKSMRTRIISAIVGLGIIVPALFLGDWIYFADADDYVHPRVLEVLLAAVTSGYDVAASGFRTSVSTDREPFEFPEEGSELPPFREIPAEACLRGIFSRKVKESLTQAVLWNKLYARKVLEGLRFEHRIMEDAFFNFEVFRRGPKVVCMDAALYSYHQRPDSYSHRTATDINAVEHLRHTISLMDRTSGMDSVTRGAALCRTYRKMLTARYMTRKTELSGVARGISDRVLSETRREFFRSRSIPLREKAMFSILWLLPPVHNFVMKRLGN